MQTIGLIFHLYIFFFSLLDANSHFPGIFLSGYRSNQVEHEEMVLISGKNHYYDRIHHQYYSFFDM